MRVPNAVHDAKPWRIRDIAADLTLLDVWALPVHGDADEFGSVIHLMLSADPASGSSMPSRLLWFAREVLGRVFGLDRSGGETLADRLPADLRGTASDLQFRGAPFVPLYRTDDEFAAELSNRTVHGVLHLGWVRQFDDTYQAEMAIYVRPRGLLGHAYMALITPFRHLVVYPSLMRQIERAWNGVGGGTRPASWLPST